MRLNKSIIMAAAPALLLAACGENAWNDHLDGFEVPPVTAAGSSTTSELTLSAEDYKTIAGLSANKAIAEADGETEALAAIGANGTFATEEQAAKYLPALLASSDKGLPYFTYDNGAAVKITYNVASQLPEQVKKINAGTLTYTVTEDEYKNAWGSEENYINAFAPAAAASTALPAILKGALTADDGQYAVVTFNQAATNPVFGDVEEKFNEIGSLKEGQNVKLRGYVTAMTSRGFILSDETGSILCYQASDFDQNAVPMFSEVFVNGPVGSYNKGLQMAISTGSYETGGVGEYTYPAPTVVTGADMDAAILTEEAFTAQYVQFTGTASVGKYININVPGAATAVGSAYQISDAIKARLEDGKDYVFTGYFVSISSGKYYNVAIADVTPVGAAAAKRRHAPLAEVPATVQNAIYQYSNGSWTEAADITLLQPEDYKAMGLSYANFSNTQPDTYLPVYLKAKYPYAAAGDTKTVAYTYRADGNNSVNAREYILGENGEWSVNAGVVTSQFVKMEGEWKFNPSVSIVLPYAKNTDPSYTYYMACVEWVYENICVPMGDTSMTSGKYFIDYRGNAEFYSGASAYYGNVDVRAESALSNMPEGYKGYDGLSNEQISELLKKRFCTEVFPAVLKKLHPDAKPIEGMDLTYTFTFTAYTGSPEETTVVYLVTGPGEFTYQSSSWVSESVSDSWKQ